MDVTVQLSEVQRRMYEEFETRLENAAASAEDEGGKGSGSSSSFAAFQYLARLCAHPCLASPSDEMVAKLTVGGRAVDDVANSPKLMELARLLRDCHGTHRVLVFAQRRSTLDLIQEVVMDRDLDGAMRYARLDGTVHESKRDAIATGFNASTDLDVLLLTTQVGGLGLTLTGADVVIFFEHDWNPQRDLQAMDRAHRIGQRKSVLVYRLIADDTVESRIMGIQTWKVRLAEHVVGHGNTNVGDNSSAVLAAPPSASSSSASGSRKRGRASSLQTMVQELADAEWTDDMYETELDPSSFVASLR